jgi:hypothetical protein
MRITMRRAGVASARLSRMAIAISSLPVLRQVVRARDQASGAGCTAELICVRQRQLINCPGPFDVRPAVWSVR